MTGNFEEYYRKYDIDKRYRHPKSYAESDSNYPPDWDERRDAIIEYFEQRCARCRRPTSELECPHNVHHYRPLGEGGTNELSNLILLCGHCHDAIHPHELDSGSMVEAPIFPHIHSDNRVAVVREPVIGEEGPRDGYGAADLKVLLQALESVSTAKENQFAVHRRTYAIGPEDARDAQSRLKEMLYNRLDGPYEILNEADWNKVRPPKMVQDRLCPRCEETKLEKQFVGFPVRPTDEKLTINIEEDGRELFPLCPSCAKLVYQSADASPEDVHCFGNIFPSDLENAPFQPDSIDLKVIDDPEKPKAERTCVVTDNGKPIKGAEIRVDREPIATTDEQGFATINVRNLPDDGSRRGTVVTAVSESPTLSGSTTLVDSTTI